ncbi:MAG: secretin N-terminal domain-containing protein, partial [Bryobacteraceae bacterium]
MMQRLNGGFTALTRLNARPRASGLRLLGAAACLALLMAAPALLTAQQPQPAPVDPHVVPGRPTPVRSARPPAPAAADKPAAVGQPAAGPAAATPQPAAAGQAAPAKPTADTQPAAAASDQSNANAAAIQNAPPVGGFSLQNANLLEVIDQLAKLAKISYILDPRVKGGVTLNTYGETKGVDPLTMLQTILRINGYAMLQMGSIYRIVPLVDLARMPIRPESQDKDIPEDERPMLNLVFLKYSSVEDIGKLLEPFLGQDGKVWSYPNANLLLVLDSRRNIRRLMELVAMFDSDTLAKQRVRVFDIVNSRPSDLAKELERVLQSVSLSKEAASVKFLPVDRINTLVAVAPNPVAFDVVEEWIKKLDIKVKKVAGKSDTYVYRVKYAQAGYLAMSIMQLYYSMSGLGFGGMYGGMGGMYGMGG